MPGSRMRVVAADRAPVARRWLYVWGTLVVVLGCTLPRVTALNAVVIDGFWGRSTPDGSEVAYNLTGNGEGLAINTPSALRFAFHEAVSGDASSQAAAVSNNADERRFACQLDAQSWMACSSVRVDAQPGAQVSFATSSRLADGNREFCVRVTRDLALNGQLISCTTEAGCGPATCIAFTIDTMAPALELLAVGFPQQELAAAVNNAGLAQAVEAYTQTWAAQPRLYDPAAPQAAVTRRTTILTLWRPTETIHSPTALLNVSDDSAWSGSAALSIVSNATLELESRIYANVLVVYGSWTPDAQSSENNVRLRLAAMDLAGNLLMPTTFTWRFDQTAPAVLVPADTLFDQGRQQSAITAGTIEFATLEPNVLAECRLQRLGASFRAEFDPCTSPFAFDVSTEVAALQAAAYEFHVRARDYAGNVGDCSSDAVDALSVAQPAPCMYYRFSLDVRTPDLVLEPLLPATARPTQGVAECRFLDSERLCVWTEPALALLIANASRVAGLECSLNGAAWIACPLYNATRAGLLVNQSDLETRVANHANAIVLVLTGLADQAHQLRVRPTSPHDVQGAILEYVWRTKAVPPTTRILSRPAPLTRRRESRFLFTLATSDAYHAGFACSTTGDEYTPCSSGLLTRLASNYTGGLANSTQFTTGWLSTSAVTAAADGGGDVESRSCRGLGATAEPWSWSCRTQCAASSTACVPIPAEQAGVQLRTACELVHGEVLLECRNQDQAARGQICPDFAVQLTCNAPANQTRLHIAATGNTTVYADGVAVLRSALWSRDATVTLPLFNVLAVEVEAAADPARLIATLPFLDAVSDASWRCTSDTSEVVVLGNWTLATYDDHDWSPAVSAVEPQPAAWTAALTRRQSADALWVQAAQGGMHLYCRFRPQPPIEDDSAEALAVHLDGNGVARLFLRAEDVFGNQEVPQILAWALDLVAPTARVVAPTRVNTINGSEAVFSAWAGEASDEPDLNVVDNTTYTPTFQFLVNTEPLPGRWCGPGSFLCDGRCIYMPACDANLSDMTPLDPRLGAAGSQCATRLLGCDVDQTLPRALGDLLVHGFNEVTVVGTDLAGNRGETQTQTVWADLQLPMLALLSSNATTTDEEDVDLVVGRAGVALSVGASYELNPAPFEYHAQIFGRLGDADSWTLWASLHPAAANLGSPRKVQLVRLTSDTTPDTDSETASSREDGLLWPYLASRTHIPSWQAWPTTDSGVLLLSWTLALGDTALDCVRACVGQLACAALQVLYVHDSGLFTCQLFTVEPTRHIDLDTHVQVQVLMLAVSHESTCQVHLDTRRETLNVTAPRSFDAFTAARARFEAIANSSWATDDNVHATPAAATASAEATPYAIQTLHARLHPSYSSFVCASVNNDEAAPAWLGAAWLDDLSVLLDEVLEARQSGANCPVPLTTLANIDCTGSSTAGPLLAFRARTCLPDVVAAGMDLTAEAQAAALVQGGQVQADDLIRVWVEMTAMSSCSLDAPILVLDWFGSDSQTVALPLHANPCTKEVTSSDTPASAMVAGLLVPVAALCASDGIHVLELFAVDQLGNPGPRLQLTARFDSVTPQVLLSNKPEPYTDAAGGQAAQFDLLCSDAGETTNACTFFCRLLDAEVSVLSVPFESCAAATRLSLSGGSYTFEAYAVDAAGNAGDIVQWSFVVDDTAPSVDLVSNIVGASSLTNLGTTQLAVVSSEDSDVICAVTVLPCVDAQDPVTGTCVAQMPLLDAYESCAFPASLADLVPADQQHLLASSALAELNASTANITVSVLARDAAGNVPPTPAALWWQYRSEDLWIRLSADSLPPSVSLADHFSIQAEGNGDGLQCAWSEGASSSAINAAPIEWQGCESPFRARSTKRHQRFCARATTSSSDGTRSDASGVPSTMQTSTAACHTWQYLSVAVELGAPSLSDAQLDPLVQAVLVFDSTWPRHLFVAASQNVTLVNAAAASTRGRVTLQRRNVTALDIELAVPAWVGAFSLRLFKTQTGMLMEDLGEWLMFNVRSSIVLSPATMLAFIRGETTWSAWQGAVMLGSWTVSPMGWVSSTFKLAAPAGAGVALQCCAGPACLSRCLRCRPDVCALDCHEPELTRCACAATSSFPALTDVRSTCVSGAQAFPYPTALTDERITVVARAVDAAGQPGAMHTVERELDLTRPVLGGVHVPSDGTRLSSSEALTEIHCHEPEACMLDMSSQAVRFEASAAVISKVVISDVAGWQRAFDNLTLPVMPPTASNFTFALTVDTPSRAQMPVISKAATNTTSVVVTWSSALPTACVLLREVDGTNVMLASHCFIQWQNGTLVACPRVRLTNRGRVGSPDVAAVLGEYERACAPGASIETTTLCRWNSRPLYRQALASDEAAEAPFLVYDGVTWLVTRSLPNSQASPLSDTDVVLYAESTAAVPTGRMRLAADDSLTTVEASCGGATPGVVASFEGMMPGAYQVCLTSSSGARACRSAQVLDLTGPAIGSAASTEDPCASVHRENETFAILAVVLYALFAIAASLLIYFRRKRSFFGFGQSADIKIDLNAVPERKRVPFALENGQVEQQPLFYDGEDISGKVTISLKNPGKKLEHYGIKVEFIGQTEMLFDRGNHQAFTSLVKELAAPGDMVKNQTFEFKFDKAEKPYESYKGVNVRLRYFVRVTIMRRISNIVKEKDLAVHTLSSYPEVNGSIKMEVGIEDSLHIEFEYNRAKYHLKDVIVGKIYFLLVRIKLKYMELAIIKREIAGSGQNVYNETETITKYEIMDGAPVRGETIPIRLFLAGFDLSPTMRDASKTFQVRYYLNLVLVDEEV
ncbi:uncharacterized protein MONBRDRAFT_36956 [Monosiga brevicollis MX1]|uniref:Ig-like domain-containing protein n=1 Tax=Monosiga brevicollis TaxID=81824 RepID=A9UYN3_MONBE|nr:uncharacterized protein MONBRDRAFT_36956 [Monosiga brevicollis MX1]EDQ89494.1 predicted protein [Monosiga brevicollis MX1]|eukprot:XP_001745523.1 hypothetical protein [Monosiga brevicollis MX1]